MSCTAQPPLLKVCDVVQECCMIVGVPVQVLHSPYTPPSTPPPPPSRKNRRKKNLKSNNCMQSQVHLHGNWPVTFTITLISKSTMTLWLGRNIKIPFCFFYQIFCWAEPQSVHDSFSFHYPRATLMHMDGKKRLHSVILKNCIFMWIEITKKITLLKGKKPK